MKKQGKTVDGLKWSAFERLFTQATQLILMLVLAKLLGPTSFGLIGMLTIFISVGQVFVDSGFSSALIRKTDRTILDYSTAFYFNIAVSLGIYSALYVFSPIISNFFNQPELTSLARILGLTLIANSFTIIPRTILTINVNFKSQAKASICSVIIGGGVGIILALNGSGVWSLAWQIIANSLCNALFYNLICKWKPVLNFNKKSFDYLYSFGGKILISGVVDALYNNVYQIIIGRKFDANSVGQFSQANQLSSIPAMTMTTIIQRVTYPILSHMQQDENKMEEYYLLLLKISSLFIFPMMVGIAVISEPLINSLLGKTWIHASELVVLLALSYMLYPIHAINLNILQVKGRSDLYLQVELIKKGLGIIILGVTVNYSIYIMCIGMLVHSYISLIFNVYYTSRITNIKPSKQLLLITPALLLSFISCFSGRVISDYLITADVLNICATIFISVFLYFSLMYALQRKWLNMILHLVNK